MDIDYKINTALKEDIYKHLCECKDDFSPSLDKKVDINEYSKKIFEKSVKFEAWFGGKLVGLIAAYFNDFESRVGYITNVSVLNNYTGKGIALKLMENCIKYAKEKEFKEMELEVDKDSVVAANLYKKFGFSNIREKEKNIFMKLIIGKK